MRRCIMLRRAKHGEVGIVNALESLVSMLDTEAIKERIAKSGSIRIHRAYTPKRRERAQMTADEAFMDALQSMPHQFQEWELIDECVGLRVPSIRARLYRMLESGRLAKVPSMRSSSITFRKATN